MKRASFLLLLSLSLVLFLSLLLVGQADQHAMAFDEEWEIATFSPRSLPGLTLWLDATDASTIRLTNNLWVTNWMDKSDMGHHAGTISNSAPTNMVFYHSGAIPGIDTRFNRMMSLPSYPAQTNQTAFFVLTPTTLAPLRWFAGRAPSTNSLDFFGNHTALNGNLGFRNFQTIVVPFTWTANVRTLFSVSRNFNELQLFHHGELRHTRAVAGGNVPDGPYGIGGKWNAGVATPRFFGFIHEVVIYGRELSEFERQQVTRYLIHRWGLRRT